ncbi:uncharacterized protein F4812DRAFT_16728 [Daldinia caldariorum]|uniref:uncharacterized protein n=1 Tax=Daldinia caldariorum TaxID=326644 RepID=UPI002007EA2D|nr:uncharacterized protein F4812DRAFT_16728 [Daldinia caldariorum]KAI1472538.1 hypothetical protein F4812DRAFT_16728 [Daldinia caldariorum]
MNSNNFSPNYVDPNRPNTSYRANIPDSDVSPPTTASQDLNSRPGHNTTTREPSPPSSQETAVPYAPTPPSAPSALSASSESEIYGPNRLFGPPLTAPENADRSLIPSPDARLSPQYPAIAMFRDASSADEFKDDLARAAGVVTPGVDDTPYIQYALDALTRDRGASGYPSSSSDGSQQPPYHFTPTAVPPPFRPPSIQLPRQAAGGNNDPQQWPLVPGPRVIALPPNTTAEDLQQGWPEQPPRAGLERQPIWDVFPDITAENEAFKNRRDQRRKLENPPPDTKLPMPRDLNHWQPRSDLNLDSETGLHNCGKALKWQAPLTLKPWVLRTQSLTLLGTLCLLMIAAIVFCAVYSMSRDGLTPYAGSIYGGQYFLFRILPQLLAIIILIYAQCVITAAFWVLPFAKMAADNRNERQDAVFLPLYPKSFLWPQLVGSWNIWIPIFNVWLLNFTIPLQSSLFTVILVDGTWKWATVQGVAWTLVALYVSFLLALVVMFVFWHRRRTGMMRLWGLRTLADIIFLVSQSNSLHRYRGLETATTRQSMRQKLDGSAERLGFWFSPEAPKVGTWYGIGESTGSENLTEKMGKPTWANQQEASLEAGDQLSDPSIRYRYLPWCFRDGQITFFAVASSILLLALIIVSFVPSTDIRKGFLPQLSPAPDAGAFSAANFLYSFIPSLLGLILFLMFQSMDLTLRILTPWGELARPEGSRAETSLLLDYSTSLPLESTYKALRNKHWRVAVVSFLSVIFALLPVLAGGLFMALTPSSGAARMYPNVPVFGIILGLLILYVGGIICLVPKRSQFRLPHAVTCLAEIISFCYDEQLCTDEAFDLHLMLESHDLAGKLDIGKDWHRQGRWAFNAGRNNDERLGIKRYSKYTVNPKKLRAYDKRARGQLISAPLPHNSSSLFNH